jgi:hypothetical protein
MAAGRSQAKAGGNARFTLSADVAGNFDAATKTLCLSAAGMYNRFAGETCRLSQRTTPIIDG